MIDLTSQFCLKVYNYLGKNVQKYSVLRI